MEREAASTYVHNQQAYTLHVCHVSAFYLDGIRVGLKGVLQPIHFKFLAVAIDTVHLGGWHREENDNKENVNVSTNAGGNGMDEGGWRQ